VPAQRLAIWDITLHQWKRPAGGFTFYVGNSSRDSQALTSTQTVTGKVFATTN